MASIPSVSEVSVDMVNILPYLLCPETEERMKEPSYTSIFDEEEMWALENKVEYFPAGVIIGEDVYIGSKVLEIPHNPQDTQPSFYQDSFKPSSALDEEMCDYSFNNLLEYMEGCVSELEEIEASELERSIQGDPTTGSASSVKYLEDCSEDSLMEVLAPMLQVLATAAAPHVEAPAAAVVHHPAAVVVHRPAAAAVVNHRTPLSTRSPAAQTRPRPQASPQPQATGAPVKRRGRPPACLGRPPACLGHEHDYSRKPLQRPAPKRGGGRKSKESRGVKTKVSKDKHNQNERDRRAVLRRELERMQEALREGGELGQEVDKKLHHSKSLVLAAKLIVDMINGIARLEESNARLQALVDGNTAKSAHVKGATHIGV